MSEETTYLIMHQDDTERKITVPSNWKVTFGPAVKGGNSGKSSYQMPMALRFYENDTKQRAIFTDVKSFRDMSIKMEVKKKRVQEKDGFMECDGIRKKTQFQAVVEEWVDPDEMNGEMPQLPDDSEIFTFND